MNFRSAYGISVSGWFKLIRENFEVEVGNSLSQGSTNSCKLGANLNLSTFV